LIYISPYADVLTIGSLLRAQTRNMKKEVKFGLQFCIRQSPGRSYGLCFRYNRAIKVRNKCKLLSIKSQVIDQVTDQT